jgi:hypothetical protein
VSLFDFLCHHVVSLALKKNMWAYSALHLRSCPTSTLAVFRITFHPKLHSYIPNIQFCLLSLQFLSTSCTSPALSAHCESERGRNVAAQTHPDWVPNTWIAARSPADPLPAQKLEPKQDPLQRLLRARRKSEPQKPRCVHCKGAASHSSGAEKERLV